MKYLVVVESENEIFYELAEIYMIRCDLAQNVLNESERKTRNLKPLETVVVIVFENDNIEVFRTANLKMYFD